jgi:hypothetical protein
MSCWRSSSLIGPTLAIGGATRLFATISGLPFASSIETRASPTASPVITAAVSKEGFRRNVSARRLDRLLVPRGEGAQGMLNAITELSQNRFQHVGRILGDEINAD